MLREESPLQQQASWTLWPRTLECSVPVVRYSPVHGRLAVADRPASALARGLRILKSIKKATGKVEYAVGRKGRQAGYGKSGGASGTGEIRKYITYQMP
jgi:hypothetical protein